MLLTACIPLYNSSIDHVESLLESLKEQTFKEFTTLIVDDNSSIDYSKLVAKWEKIIPIKYIKNTKNLGMTGNWNKALENTITEYFIMLGHDDILSKNAFLELLSPLLSNDEIICSCCSAKYINEEGIELAINHNVNHRSNIFKEKASYVIDAKNATRLCLKNGIAFGELSSQMFRLSGVTRKYSDDFKHAADLDFFLSNIRKKEQQVFYTTQKLLIRRIHSSALTQKNYLNGHVTKERLAIFNKHKSNFEFTSDEIEEFRSFVFACALYDLSKSFSHKSKTVILTALKQTLSEFRPRPLIHYRLAKSIFTMKNMDAQ